HNGTFRGNNAAFVTATAALESFWSDTRLTDDVRRRHATVMQSLGRLAERFHPHLQPPRGKGLLCGLGCREPEIAGRILGECYERGLILETSGGRDEVVKLLPPLTVTDDELDTGLAILADSVEAALS
ncbi:MAG: aminotransferase class III-fold pyridoxal phosphate-dependent enzyme, partial [Actinomycetota bacterium]